MRNGAGGGVRRKEFYERLGQSRPAFRPNLSGEYLFVKDRGDTMEIGWSFPGIRGPAEWYWIENRHQDQSLASRCCRCSDFDSKWSHHGHHPPSQTALVSSLPIRGIFRTSSATEHEKRNRNVPLERHHAGNFAPVK